MAKAHYLGEEDPKDVDLGNIEEVQQEDHSVSIYFDSAWYLEFSDDEIEDICAIYLD